MLPMGNMSTMKAMFDNKTMFVGNGGSSIQINAGSAIQRNAGPTIQINGNRLPNNTQLSFSYNQMGNNRSCHSFSSSSVMTCTTDESGRPQVYQASSSTKIAPGGVKETINSVQDSRTGLQKMAIGRHIKEKGHVVEKKKNRYTGDEEKTEELINLEDDEVDRFDKEWQEKAKAFNGHNSRSSRRPMQNMDEYEDSHQPKKARSQSVRLAITYSMSSSEHSGAAKKKAGKQKRKGTSGRTKRS